MNPGPRLVLAVFLGFVLLFSINAFKESDAFYHLKTGQVIWETRSVPAADIFSYTAPGARWVTHEWLAQILEYAAFLAGGYWGVIIFAALLSAAAYGLLYLMALRRGVAPLHAAFALFAVGSLTFELWIPRPQIFSFVLAAGVLYLLESYRAGGRRNLLWGVLVLVWLWANLHASVTLAFALIAGYVFVLFMENRRDLAVPLFMFLFAAIAVSLLNPNGYGVWLYPFYIAPAVSNLNIMEWASIFEYLYLAESRAFVAEIAVGNLLLLAWLWRRRRMDWAVAGLIWAASVLPFVSIRHVGFWPMLAGFPLAVVVGDVLRRTPFPLAGKKAIFALAAVLAVLFVGRTLNLPRQYFNQDTVPVHAADFMVEQGISGRRFNLYNEGGYLIWRFHPDQKVFVDGRSEVYPPEVLNDLREITLVGPDWKGLVDEKYGIDHFLLAYRPAELGKSVLPLVRRLMEEGWPLVYWDDASLIFVRPTESNRQVIEKFGLHHVSPYRDFRSVPQEEMKEVAAEFYRLLELVPHSKVVQAFGLEFVSRLK